MQTLYRRSSAIGYITFGIAYLKFDNVILDGVFRKKNSGAKVWNALDAGSERHSREKFT